MLDQPTSPPLKSPEYSSHLGDMVIEVDPEYEKAPASSSRSESEAEASTTETVQQRELQNDQPSNHQFNVSQETSPIDQTDNLQKPGFAQVLATVGCWLAQPLTLVGLNSNPNLDGRYDDLKVKRLVEYPDGYPQYAAFIDTDSNFRIFRRFGTLRTRVILKRQLELWELEKELDKLDELDNTPDRQYRLASIGWDEEENDSKRKDLLDLIDEKLKEYDALLARERDSLSMDKPTKRNQRNLVNYNWNKRTIAKHETELLNRIDDFVILSKDQDSPFHTFLEDCLQKYPLAWLQRIFVSEDQREKVRGAEKTKINLYSKTRINALIRLIVTLITVILLMIPVCLLFKLDMNDKMKVLFVLIFVLIFPVAISIFAKPRHHDLFAATAAYTAVLVVFLTNFSGQEGKRES